MLKSAYVYMSAPIIYYPLHPDRKWDQQCAISYIKIIVGWININNHLFLYLFVKIKENFLLRLKPVICDVLPKFVESHITKMQLSWFGAFLLDGDMCLYRGPSPDICMVLDTWFVPFYLALHFFWLLNSLRVKIYIHLVFRVFDL